MALEFKKTKFPLNLFVTASLLNLFIVIMIFIGAKILFSVPVTEDSGYRVDESVLEQDDPLVTKVPQFEDTLTRPIISDIDPSLGSPRAPVTIVQYSDFQCEYCFEQEKTLKMLPEDYLKKIRIIWKDYPENDPESLSWKASLAGRCAQAQDRFWQYHDLLYKNMDKLDDGIFIELAKQLKLDLDDFNECLAGRKADKLIMDNITEANSLEISGIPFIFINDQELMGQVSLDELKNAINYQMNAKTN